MVLRLVITVAATEEPEQVLAVIHLIVKYIYGLAQGLFGMWILLE